MSFHTRVSLLLGSPNADYAGEIVAIDKGYFSDNNLDIELISSIKSIDAVDLLKRNEAEFAIVGSANAIIEKDQGIDLKVIGFQMQKEPIRWFTLDPQIKSPRDFVSKKIATRNVSPVMSAVWRKTMRSFHLAKEDIQQVPIGFDPVEPLMDRKVDVSIGYITDLASFPKNANVFTLNPTEFGIRSLPSGILSSGRFLSDNSDTAQAFLRALFKGWREVLLSPTKAVESLISSASNMDKLTQLARLRLVIRELLGLNIVNEKGFGFMDFPRCEETIMWFHEAGLIRRKMNPQEVFTLQYLPRPPIFPHKAFDPNDFNLL